MGRFVRWILATGIVAIVVVVPLIHYRYVYQTEKRLRTVEPNQVYRSGQMTAEGFAEAVRELHIRTIINLQDDFPDPDIETSFLSGHSIKESELCGRLKVKFVAISPDLVSRRQVGQRRPEAIEQFLAVMDDKSNYPVLMHCRAGLNRTGMMVALYRMEYDGWSSQHALQEALYNGFGRTTGTSANDYIKQYVLTYEPGKRQPEALGKAPPHIAPTNRSAEHALAGQR
jgi:tyrosine-protein phosphatase SIW14